MQHDRTAETEGNPGIEVWRGGVNTWECDEMGHMNSRFYVARCVEGLGVLFAHAGLPFLPGPGGAGSVRLEELHIRFHREARAATPLHMTAGFSRVGGGDAEAVLLLWHSLDGTLAATFRAALRHDGQHDGPLGTAAAWPAAFGARAQSLATAVPPEARPRGVNAGAAWTGGIDLSAHRRIALGTLAAADCDLSGRMLPQKFIGAVSDGIRQLTAPLREIVARHAEAPPQRVGGAVLEFRIVHLGWPSAGDCYEIRSAFRKADGRTMLLEHWLADPVSGRALGYMESVAAVFDIERRRIVGITDAAREALRPFALAA